MKTRITQALIGKQLVHMVWYQCPQSGIFQTYASFDTVREAKACAKEVRSNGI